MPLDAPLFDTELPTSAVHPSEESASTPSGSSVATTLISELSSAVGMIRRTLPEALAHRPSELVDVDDETWRRYVELYDHPGNHRLFHESFDNGRAFASSEVALRHRHPSTIEWLGPRKVVGEHAIPADLRVDEVFLVSCKYNSKNVLNSSPAKLFDHRLKDVGRTGSWYEEVALDAYQDYFRSIRAFYDLIEIPLDVRELTDVDRAILAATLPRRLPSELATEQALFSEAVALASAKRWDDSLGSATQRNDFAMSLLRIPQAIYFLLGQRSGTPLRFKILSRWDWTKRFAIDSFEMSPRDANQPTVDWRLQVTDRRSGNTSSVQGHVEVRWSHGRFNGAPEAKVYLDSPMLHTPGYVALDR